MKKRTITVNEPSGLQRTVELTIEEYKGYELQIYPVTDNPNGRNSQTVLIYLKNVFAAAAFADTGFENAVEKAKAKVDTMAAAGPLKGLDRIKADQHVFGGKSGVLSFLDACINDLELGLGFHPDTDFADYIHKDTDKPVFKKKDAKILNQQLNECFWICEQEKLDIYALALEFIQPIFDELNKTETICEVAGCKNKATHLVTPLFDAPVMKMCDSCKPDVNNRPENIKDLPFCYKVEKLNK